MTPYHVRERGTLRTVEVDGKGKTVVLFHGYGADCYDLLFLSETKRVTPHWLFPEAPLEVAIAPGYVGRAWFPIDLSALRSTPPPLQEEILERVFPKEIEAARAHALSLVKALEVPLSEVVLGGFSQGSVLALETALHLEEPVGGLVLLSGTLCYEREWGERLSRLKGVPFFQSHGRDDLILPYSRAERLEQFLQAGGLRGSLLTFAGGHELPLEVRQALYRFLGEKAIREGEGVLEHG